MGVCRRGDMAIHGRWCRIRQMKIDLGIAGSNCGLKRAAKE